ncbi:MAG TPA: (Fe-S)-binding protein [Dyella sp.]
MPHEKPPLRIASLADQCVQCGLCLPVCPTYALDGNEAESPRGRIAIAAALARGDVEPTAALREHLDHCLGCLNCERVCPAYVQYGELLVETRAMIGPMPGRPRLLLAMIQRPALLRLAGRLGKALGSARWKKRLAERLPAASSWRAALNTLPDAANDDALKSSLADSPSAQPSIALFPGCVASVEDAAAQQAAIVLLRAAGYRISLLPAFCCGAIDLHGGEAQGAERAAQRVRDAWQASGAEQLVSITPGCLGTLRRALPGVTVADPVTLLSARADRLRFGPLARSVALHLPCTQTNVARSEGALLTLLRQVPELEVKPVPRPPHCCGAAGSHMLEFPERAARLRDDTLEQIADLAPQQLLSSNIGCRLHLAAGMDEGGRHWPHLHPLTLLAQQLIS